MNPQKRTSGLPLPKGIPSKEPLRCSLETTSGCNVMIRRRVRWGEPSSKVLSQLAPCEKTLESAYPIECGYWMTNVSGGLRLGNQDRSTLVTDCQQLKTICVPLISTTLTLSSTLCILSYTLRTLSSTVCIALRPCAAAIRASSCVNLSSRFNASSKSVLPGPAVFLRYLSK